jgi:hypothetical protein
MKTVLCRNTKVGCSISTVLFSFAESVRRTDARRSSMDSAEGHPSKDGGSVVTDVAELVPGPRTNSKALESRASGRSRLIVNERVRVHGYVHRHGYDHLRRSRRRAAGKIDGVVGTAESHPGAAIPPTRSALATRSRVLALSVAVTLAVHAHGLVHDQACPSTCTALSRPPVRILSSPRERTCYLPASA